MGVCGWEGEGSKSSGGERCTGECWGAGVEESD